MLKGILPYEIQGSCLDPNKIVRIVPHISHTKIGYDIITEKKKIGIVTEEISRKFVDLSNR